MRWKYIAIALLVLGILLPAAGYLLLRTQDFNRYKGMIARAARDATGRELTLGGDIHVGLSFWPTLVATDAGLANASWGSQPEMVRIQRLEVQLSLLRLLAGDVDLRRITMLGVDLLLETDASGLGNWEFRAAEGKGEQGFWPVRQLDVGDISIEDLRLTFHNGKTGSRMELSLSSLEAARDDFRRVLEINLKGVVNKQMVALSGQTGLISNAFAREKFPIDLSGQIAGATIAVRGAVSDGMDLKGIDLEIHCAGKNLAEAASAVGFRVLDTDAFDLKGRLEGSATALALKVAGGNVSFKGVQVTGNGSVGEILTLGGIALQVQASGKNLAEVGPVIGQNLPDTGPFTLEGRLSGSAEALSLQDAQGKAARGTLDLTLTGSVKDLLAVSGLRLNAELAGQNLSEVGPVIGQSLPETGPFTIAGRLTGSAKALSLQDARGRADRGSLNLTLTGSVKDLLAVSGMDLNVELAGRNLAEVGPVIGQGLPDSGPFTLGGRLTGSAKALSLQNVRANATSGSVNLTLNGGVKELLVLRGLDLNIRCAGERLSDARPWVGGSLPDLGRFDLKGHLTGSAAVLELDGLSVLVGQSDLNGSAKVEFRKRPKVTAVLQSGLIDLTPLMKLEQAEEKKVAESPGHAGGLFSGEPLPFDRLEAVDADISLTARNIRSRDAKWEFGRLALKLEEADLRVEKLEAVYKGTKVSGSAFVQPKPSPRVGTKFLVQDFDVGAFLREIHVSEKAKGHLDIAVDVSSQGSSVKALMAHLDGTGGAVMGKGYLVKYLDWLAQDLTQKVIPIWGENEKAGVIDCGVVEFDIKNGLATSKAFVLSSPASVMTGEGTINLETEKLDFLLKPAPKHPSLFSLATNLRVTGTIENPEVSPDYESMALKGARALSVFLVGPVGLLTPFMNLGADKSHPCDVKELKGQGLQSIPKK